MLLLGSRLLNIPVMSLQTGGRLAVTSKPIIDPASLHIISYQIEGPLLTEQPSFVRTADVREYGHLGLIIDSSDELIGLDDVIKVTDLYKLGFPLIGMKVIDEHKHALGKVEDYSIDTLNFVVQQLQVKRGFIRGLTDTGFLVNRSQIIEINDQAIVVKSLAEKSAQPVMQALRNDFVNPFRNPNRQTEPETISDSSS